jgi:hypothetical protein
MAGDARCPLDSHWSVNGDSQLSDEATQYWILPRAPTRLCLGCLNGDALPQPVHLRIVVAQRATASGVGREVVYGRRVGLHDSVEDARWATGPIRSCTCGHVSGENA